MSTDYYISCLSKPTLGHSKSCDVPSTNLANQTSSLFTGMMGEIMRECAASRNPATSSSLNSSASPTPPDSSTSSLTLAASADRQGHNDQDLNSCSVQCNQMNSFDYDCRSLNVYETCEVVDGEVEETKGESGDPGVEKRIESLLEQLSEKQTAIQLYDDLIAANIQKAQSLLCSLQQTDSAVESSPTSTTHLATAGRTPHSRLPRPPSQQPNAGGREYNTLQLGTSSLLTSSQQQQPDSRFPSSTSTLSRSKIRTIPTAAPHRKSSLPSPPTGAEHDAISHNNNNQQYQHPVTVTTPYSSNDQLVLDANTKKTVVYRPLDAISPTGFLYRQPVINSARYNGRSERGSSLLDKLPKWLRRSASRSQERLKTVSGQQQPPHRSERGHSVFDLTRCPSGDIFLRRTDRASSVVNVSGRRDTSVGKSMKLVVPVVPGSISRLENREVSVLNSSRQNHHSGSKVKLDKGSLLRRSTAKFYDLDADSGIFLPDRRI